VYPYFKPIAEQRDSTVKVGGGEMIITDSNDYLGLTQDPWLKVAAVAVFDTYGTSCTGSRFLTGALTPHQELERRLADFLRLANALVSAARALVLFPDTSAPPRALPAFGPSAPARI
jgi:7-keto-8-aminopelargonate synthetase-like enzyme